MKQHGRKQTKPRARKEGLVIQELPDEVLVYDLERDRALCLNQTAAFVWQRCDGRTSAAAIARSLGKKLDVSVDENLVWFAVDQLRRNYLMNNTAVPTQAIAGMNRRQMVQALGVAAAVALPVVVSIVAPTPAQAVSCAHTGGACTISTDCCSGCTCSSNVCVGSC
jgi:hypothetical protein